MLNIFKDIYLRFTFKMALIFLAFCLGVYFLLAPYIPSASVWVALFALVTLVFFLLVYMLHDLHQKLKEDIDALSFYLNKLDAKKYDTKIKIKNYLEFLELSLLLKNLVKRLHNKDKKTKK